MHPLLTLSLLLAVAAPAMAAPAAPAPVTYKTELNLPYRPDSGPDITQYMRERCRLDLCYPENRKGFSTVVWFHGGGLSGGEKGLPDALKNQGLAVVGVNYRLIPKVKGAACIDDAAAAVAWTLQHIAHYGGDPHAVFVTGHSAGGYLTLMIGLDKQWLAKYGADANQLAGLIPLSGHTITHFAIRAEQGIGDKTAVVDAFAPLYHARGDAPPILLITGDREMEMLGRYEENAYLMRMLKLNGHPNVTLFEIQGYGHGMVEPAWQPLREFVARIRPPAPHQP